MGKILKMNKFMTGSSNKGQEPAAVRNPVNNELIVEPDEIKGVTLQYCQPADMQFVTDAWILSV